ncbi:hypothetical protein OEZ85_013951 [Tetradesmus obliquus]|uniref:Uncharacterized protein n=1 Tax=Tetradesmus obliquus TaxID=3088 RepID=A0ABY8UBJ7_TETOB|nr:hypothetical protein OEZ85_013951 [Tetradesmus obliquus]
MMAWQLPSPGVPDKQQLHQKVLHVIPCSLQASLPTTLFWTPVNTSGCSRERAGKMLPSPMQTPKHAMAAVSAAAAAAVQHMPSAQ